MAYRISAALVLLIPALLFVACAEGLTGGQDRGALMSLEYSYGSFNRGEWNFSVKNAPALTQDGEARCLFTAKGYNGVDMDVELFLGPEVLEDIAAIIRDNGIFAWNGFNKRDRYILDGHSFNLSAIYEKGAITASGYEKYPTGYAKGHGALSAYLMSLADNAEPVEIGGEDSVKRIWLTFYEESGKYTLSAHGGNDKGELFKAFATEVTPLYNQCRGQRYTTDGEEYCRLEIEVLVGGIEPSLYCKTYIDKAAYPEAYTLLLEKSRAFDEQR